MAQITTTANLVSYNGLKFSQDGKPRISFRAAETARIKDQSGQWVDGGTTWYNVTLFGGASEALDQLIANQGGKGKVLFSGRMSTREYEHNGEKRESLDVVADSVGLVPKNQQSGNQQPQQHAHATSQGGWGGQPQNSGGWGNETGPAF